MKNKIGIIIRREFNERVRKKTFILTTLLTPVLLVAVMVLPALIIGLKGSEVKTIMIYDPSGMIAGQIEDTKKIKFETTDLPIEQFVKERDNGKYQETFGILEVGAMDGDTDPVLKLYTYGSSTVELESAITKQVSKIIETDRLKQYNIENLGEILKKVRPELTLHAYKIDSAGQHKESSSIAAMGLAMAGGLLIYTFIFLYGGMVLQGVVEEKSSKVLEIIVSSVRPFELMMGKILGIAMVALTQFFIWILLIIVLGTILLSAFAGEIMSISPEMLSEANIVSGMDASTVSAMRTLTDALLLLKIFFWFIVYFIGGYLLYAAMYAAIGSAVENVSDSQQLQLPVTIPMLIGLLVLFNVTEDPTGSLAFWFSIIPFTSPIVMLARIPYDVPAWQLALSVALLYGSFVFMVWFAGKIYRVGIFMYGKKPSLKEILKWAGYKS